MRENTMTMRTYRYFSCPNGHKGTEKTSENDQPYSTAWESVTTEGMREAGTHLTRLRGGRKRLTRNTVKHEVQHQCQGYATPPRQQGDDVHQILGRGGPLSA